MVAFDFQNDNLFELTKIFTEADIKAIMKDNTLFDRFSPALDKYSKLVEEKIIELDGRKIKIIDDTYLTSLSKNG